MNIEELWKKESLKLYISTFIAFTAIGILIALDEILDLPHLIFGAAATPINWIEIITESFFIFAIFMISIYSLTYIRSRSDAALKKLKEAEQEVANVWKRREGILDGITEPTITIAPNGDITYVNDLALNLTGYTREEALSAKCYTIFRPKGEDCKGDRCLLRNMPEGILSMKNIERTIIAKDGTEIECLMSCARVKDAEGKILGGMEILRDVREERRRLREIEESENELAIMNEELRTANEDLNESYIELKERDDRLERLNEELVKINDELKISQARIEHQRRLLESYSRLIGILNSEIDLDRLIEKTLDGIMEFTKSQIGRVYLYDEDSKTLKLHTSYGVTEEKNSVLKLGEGLVGEAARKQKLVMVEEDNHEWEVITLNGSISPRAILCMPVVYQDELLAVVGLGSITMFDEDVLAFVEDFTIQYATAIKNAISYRSIEELNEKIQRANEMKSEFLANVSHELRTPMTSILGFTKRVMKKSEGVLPEKEIKQLEIVYRNGEELLNLVNGLLDLSKIESGEIEFDIEDFNLKDLVDEVVDLALPLAEDKGLRIVKEAEAVELTSDRKKIKEMLVNLVGNAIKFTDKGEVRLVVATQNEDHIDLTVEDTGVGVSEEDLESIFDEFKQVGCGSRKRHGTGLGLAITKKYAEMLGEGIKVESEVGKGTKFTIQLKKHIVKEEVKNE
ncbi:MAG: PAS domain-containing sensor histidine kinase [Candidatus Syntropharchaeales archaeon]